MPSRPRRPRCRGGGPHSAVYMTCPEAVSTPPDGDIYRLEGWIYHIQPVL